MKKLIVCLTLAAFAVVTTQAGGEACDKSKAAACSSTKASAQAKAGTACSAQSKAVAKNKSDCCPSGKASAKTAKKNDHKLRGAARLAI